MTSKSDNPDNYCTALSIHKTKHCKPYPKAYKEWADLRKYQMVEMDKDQLYNAYIYGNTKVYSKEQVGGAIKWPKDSR